MYKIYINETPLYLLDSEKSAERQRPDGEVILTPYLGKSKYLLNYIDLLEKTNRYAAVLIYAQDYQGLLADYKRLYKEIEAAGGVVYNPENKVLMIYRRGYWDLPKGKIDRGEAPAEAAVREVQEETGIQDIRLGKLVHHSFHTYRNGKGKRILKRTHWYKMNTNDVRLVPETEEDIEKAVWVDLKAFLMQPKRIYRSILDVLDQANRPGREAEDGK